MGRSLIVYGPQGCGKTRLKDQIAARYGLENIVDDWAGEALPWTNTLALTCLTREEVDRARAAGVDAMHFFNVQLPGHLKNTITVFEYGSASSQSRRVSVAACPDTNNPTRNPLHGHELAVADCFPDDLSHVYCTCGWVGDGFETDTVAVDQFNASQGVSTHVLTEWES